MNTDEPIFNASELSDNRKRKEKLFDLIGSGDSILMVGAGCSASIYPDWQGFVKILENAASTIDHSFASYDDTKENFLVFADRVKKCITPDSYYRLIFQNFKPRTDKTHEKYHEVLCYLLHMKKFRAIATTNYDVVLEYALTIHNKSPENSVYIDDNVEQAQIFEFLYSLNHGNLPRKIFHIHGKYDRKDSIILCQEEYTHNYGFQLAKPTSTIYQALKEGSVLEPQFENLLYQHGMVWTQHRKILWSLFATRRLVFIGFSMTDPYFRKMLEDVSRDLHTSGYDTHYLILRITKKDEEKTKAFALDLKEKYGVETVFYEDEDGDYSELERFIYEIDSAVNQKFEPTSPPSSEEPVKLSNEEDLTNYLLKISEEKNDSD